MAKRNFQTFEPHYFDQYTLGFADDKDQIQLEEIKSLDAVILRKSEPVFTRYQIRAIRTSREENIYLVPLFILGSIEDLETNITQLVDSSLSSIDQLRHASEQVFYIKERLQNL